eukprot:CAMPEP_0172853572 /NCGR_PEP_ID=MMETSP1075-20121228/57221_1 /TAXON_ID=2916 /ORGANISM="Ceratium fusus, Strain PA161109" /LENGTH=235 /DNA_ID=CAMNT_0013700083 /DNA_START=90 /DNA_END=794 /DNA_ORIENTATION=+
MRRALSCCCLQNDQTDANQISYGGDPMMDEWSAGPPALPLPPGTAGQPGKTAFMDSLASDGLMNNTTMGSLGSPGQHTSRSTSLEPVSARLSMSPEDRQKEKERVQDMVKEFAKVVVQGQQCQWLPVTLGPARAATYAIDKALRTFSLRPEDSVAVVVDMIRIQEIVKDARSTPYSQLLGLPRPHSNAGDDLERRFVCIVHEDSSSPNEPQYIGLLMPNPYERERFYTCMKILRW